MAKKKPLPKVDPYLEGLMGKLLERLLQLEKKMDQVLAQTAKASSAPAASSAAAPAPPRRERQLYEAICADCSKVCEVPFRPSEDRAVYCKICWAKRKSGGQPHGMPILKPVVLPPKPPSKPLYVPPVAPVAAPPAKKTSSKKAKKKRR
jgi:CxxC-x17-CxxC domain-containing protein